jgi:hypothetical protein
VSHDALRLLACQGTALAGIGEDGVRYYTAQPLMADHSVLARRQAVAWRTVKKERVAIARRTYAWVLAKCCLTEPLRYARLTARGSRNSTPHGGAHRRQVDGPPLRSPQPTLAEPAQSVPPTPRPCVSARRWQTSSAAKKWKARAQGTRLP